MTLPKMSKMWYVMHGVLWVYCAHGAHRLPRGPGPSRVSEVCVSCIRRSVSAGGYPHLSGDNRGFPKQFEENE